jgi:hypothetical protein
MSDKPKPPLPPQGPPPLPSAPAPRKKANPQPAPSAAKAPPSAKALAPVIAPVEYGPVTWKQRFESSLPWLASGCSNLVLLLILGLFFLPALVEERRMHEVTVMPFEARESDLSGAVQMTEAESEETFAQADLQELAAVEEPELELEPTTEIPTPGALGEAAPFSTRPTAVRSSGPSGRSLLRPLNLGRPPAPLTKKELAQTDSIEAAVDGIGMQILEMLDRGDLLVLWMLDSSISLVNDRRLIAFRLNDVYRQIDVMRVERAKAKGVKPPLLRSGVVAYGADVMQVLKPTVVSTRAALKVADIPIDETGQENVFSATQWCVAKYADSWKKQVLLVVWTDETGDDTHLLEPTIALCKQYNVRVCVVGPTAVFGAEQGSHAFIHPANNQLYWLPVRKGPETAFPERMLWPYWWNSRLPEWHDASIPVDYAGGWYGGYDMLYMSSGFPPYSLTRLARETGGGYTLFDRPMDRGPFTLEAMRAYTPDYRSAAEIFDEIHFVPFRRSIMAAVEVTRNVPRDAIPNPTPHFFVSSGFMRAQARFYAKESKEALVKAELALLPFGPDGLEDLYEKEPSARWKAWYDLTRGRLLAQSVRYAETLTTCNLALGGGINDDMNCIQFGPLSHVLSGPAMEARAKEAERLLKRCIENNPQTPWAYLADRELQHPVGLGCRVWYVEPPPPVLDDRPPPAASGGGGGNPIVMPKL